MGGELGSLVASLLEREPWVGALCGIDVDPPRRRLRIAEFHRIAPSDRERIIDVVTAFDPHVLIHLAVWEPDARAGTAHAKQFTADATTAILGAAAECPSLERIVVRSGIEIYGRVENLTDKAWPLRVIDRVPYAEQEDLQITHTATPAETTADYDDKRGVLAWDLDLAAGAKQVIKLDTTMRWPADQVLQ